MTGLLHDLRYAIRQLRKNPGFTAAAVITLALGIGVNTAIFSVMNVMLLKALPVKNPQELVEFVRHDPRGDFMTNLPPEAFAYLRKDTSVLSGIFAFWSEERVLHSSSGSEPIVVHMVSGDFFATLGVRPLLGRPLDSGDTQVVVLSYSFWSSHFGRDPSVLGSTMRIDRALGTIIGVMPPEFFGVDRGEVPQMWVPFPPGPIQSEVWVLGRLKPQVSIAQARARLEPLLAEALNSTKDSMKDWPAHDRDAVLAQTLVVNRATTGTSGLRWQYWEYSNTLKILLGMTGIILLIACLNVANLLMARTAARGQEIGIRLAIGAGRRRILRQVLTENLMLAMAGAMAGLLVARWGHQILVAFEMGRLEGEMLSFRLDTHVLWFSFAVAILAGLLSGVLPALRAAHSNIGPAIQARGATRLPIARKLLVGQAALSLVLLVGAGLFVRSLRNLAATDLGLARDNLFLLAVAPPPSASLSETQQFWTRLTTRLATVPGVRAASVAGSPVFSGGWNTAIWTRQPDGSEQNAQIAMNDAGPGFFGTVGIPLLAGREFGSQDQASSPAVAVVNRAFAQRFFHGKNPIGEHFGSSGPGSSGNIEIVGMIADAKYSGLRAPPQPMFYRPLYQELVDRSYNVHVRAAGDLPAVVAAVRREIQNMDPDLSVYPAQTISEIVEGLLQHDRMFAVMAGVFGLLALLLTAVGTYGMVAWQVTRRTQEIGIRLALGAERRNIFWIVLRETLRFVAIGVGIGVPAAVFAGGALRSVLFGVPPSDPATIAGAAAMLIAVALLASYIPARRAAKVEPMEALRYE
jgi:predicted permease